MVLSVRSVLLTRPTLGDSFPPTRPTDCFAIAYPGRALFPGADGETHCLKVRPNDPSELARTSFLRGGLGGFLLRAWTSTSLYLKMRSFWCAAFGEQRKLPSPPIHCFAEPCNDRGMWFNLSPEQWSDIGVVPPSELPCPSFERLAQIVHAR